MVWLFGQADELSGSDTTIGGTQFFWFDPFYELSLLEDTFSDNFIWWCGACGDLAESGYISSTQLSGMSGQARLCQPTVVSGATSICSWFRQEMLWALAERTVGVVVPPCFTDGGG